MAEIAQIIRDILLSVFLAGGILLTLVLLVVVFLLYKAVRALIQSVNHITDNIGEFSDVAVENLVGPMREGVSFSSALGNAFGFVTGFVSGMRGGRTRRAESHDDRDRGRRRRR